MKRKRRERRKKRKEITAASNHSVKIPSIVLALKIVPGYQILV